jgi:hypothetical protein
MSLLVRTSTDVGALLVRDTDDPKALAVTESTSPLALRVRESTSPLAMRVRGLFSPASLPGLAAWYDASDPATVLTTISPDVPASDGQTVRRWLDKSGNGRHLEQADLTLQPVFTNAGTGLTFDDVNDIMSMAFNWGNEATVFVCGRMNSSVGNARIISTSNSNVFLPCARVPSGFEQLIASDAAAISSSPISTPIGENLIFTLFADSGADTGGISKNLGSVNSMAATFTTPRDGIAIGMPGTTRGVGWSITDVVFYNRNMTVAERERVIRWLSTKRGITV